MDAERQAVLFELVCAEGDLDDIGTRLRRYPWDWDGNPLVVVAPEDVRAVLTRYRAGAMTSGQLEQWANLIECREDLDFDGGQDGAVRDAIHILANPVLEGALTNEVAARLEASLGSL